ncbi:hypothetical protein LUZ60_007751 [Juncus effusus]|nr:hypothetical protein LUZ60_007751 [Juncus effusus]
MAKSLFLLLSFLIQSTIFQPNLAQEYKTEKSTQIRVYWHDLFTGPNPTSIRVAESPQTKSSSVFFGAVVVIDDPLTVGPELSTDLIGRAQGMYTFADSKELGALMTMNFVFTKGEYNGSTISIFGRNHILSAVREMSIVGGTGVFRMARGYAHASTNATANSVEYNLFVNHY